MDNLGGGGPLPLCPPLSFRSREIVQPDAPASSLLGHPLERVNGKKDSRWGLGGSEVTQEGRRGLGGSEVTQEGRRGEESGD